MRIFYNTIGIASFVFLFPIVVQASVLYMEPAEGTYGPGDTFSANIKIDVGQECVNTADVYLEFPKGAIKAEDFMTGDSIINIWVEKPGKADMDKINEVGLIHFSGGIPGGFCGRVPGDQGFSNILATIVFKVPSFRVNDNETDKFNINFMADTKVYLNDGLGTVDQLMTKNGAFNLSKSPTNPAQDWQKQIDNDKIQPEPFMIEVNRSQKMFENKYYIIFYTTDKQTGIDHYEVQEQSLEDIEPVSEKGWWGKIWPAGKKTALAYKSAKMPYVLEDQTLDSIIRVKAIDKAGNERIEEYTPPATMRPVVKKPFYSGKNLVLLTTGIIIILVIVLVIFIIKKRRTHAKPKQDPISKNQE